MRAKKSPTVAQGTQSKRLFRGLSGQKAQPTEKEAMSQRSKESSHCVKNLSQQISQGIDHRQMLILEISFSGSSSKRFLGLARHLLTHFNQTEMGDLTSEFAFTEKCETLNWRNESKTSTISKELIGIFIPFIEQAMRTFRNDSNPVDGYFYNEQEKRLMVLFILGYPNKSEDFGELKYRFLNLMLNEVGFSLDETGKFKQFFKMEKFSEKKFKIDFSNQIRSKLVRKNFRRTFKSMSRYVRFKFIKSRQRSLQSPSRDNHPPPAAENTRVDPAPELLTKRSFRQSQESDKEPSQTQKSARDEPEAPVQLKTKQKLPQKPGARLPRRLPVKATDKALLEELNRFARLDRKLLGRRLTPGDGDIYASILQNKQSKSLISEQKLAEFFEKKPFIKAFLEKNGYKSKDILGNSNIELLLGCLMGYISEKDKRCLDNMIVVGDLDNRQDENVKLVMRNLVLFVKNEVASDNPRNPNSTIATPSCECWTTFGRGSSSSPTGTTSSSTAYRRCSSPSPVPKGSLTSRAQAQNVDEQDSGHHRRLGNRQNLLSADPAGPDFGLAAGGHERRLPEPAHPQRRHPSAALAGRCRARRVLQLHAHFERRVPAEGQIPVRCAWRE